MVLEKAACVVGSTMVIKMLKRMRLLHENKTFLGAIFVEIKLVWFNESYIFQVCVRVYNSTLAENIREIMLINITSKHSKS